MQETSIPARPLNVLVARGSLAERVCRARAGLPGRVASAVPELLAPGLEPTPAHDLVFHGGKTIAAMTFTHLYVGGAAAWDKRDIANIDRALPAAMSDVGLNNVMAQYFRGETLSTTFLPSRVLDGPQPATVSQGDVEALAQNLYASGALGTNNLDTTVFCFMLPRGTVLTTDAAPSNGTPNAAALPTDAADSLHGLGGYHGSVHASNASGGTSTVYYAVGAYSETAADGTTNGIPVFDQAWKNVVATFYHELNEARTDTDVEDAIRAGNDPAGEKFLGWTSRQGEECGDFPVFEANPLTLVFQEVALADGSGTVPVQFQYSNAVHGPEGPRPTPDPPA